MKEELQITNNTLADIIRFLQEGNIVCLHCNKYGYHYYYSVSSCTNITDEKLIYINIESMPSLIEDEEWPWYILSEGFVKYQSINVLPTNKDNIYFFMIP